MPVQEVILGKIIDNQKEKFCVACKDFKEKGLAPVYDCGSCLYPSATDNDLKDFLKSKEEIEKRVYEFPNSAIKLNDKKINYYNFLLTTDNRECILSLKKQTKKINEKFLEIKSFINQLSVLSDTRKNFYIKILEKRKELILEYSLEKQIEKEKIK